MASFRKTIRDGETEREVELGLTALCLLSVEISQVK